MKRFTYSDSPHTEATGSSFAFIHDRNFYRENMTEISKWLNENNYKIQSYGSRNLYDMVIVFNNPEEKMTFKLTWDN